MPVTPFEESARSGLAQTPPSPPTSAPPTTVSVSTQLAYTSYLRVAAIIGVVLIHTAGLTYINDDLRGTGVWWVAAALTFSVKWAVPVFVMVSGSLLLKPPVDRSAKLFYRRRLSRIGIPLVVWHVVYITLKATIERPRRDPAIHVARFLRGESYTGLYYFWLILGLYLITPLLWPVIAGISRRALGGAGALLVLSAAANRSMLQVIGRLEDGSTPAGDPTILSTFVPFIGYFLLGYALRDVIVRGRGRVIAFAVLTAALCLEMVWQATGGASMMFGVPTANWLNILAPIHYQGWILGASAVAIFVLFRSVVHPQSRWAQPRAARRARSVGDLALGVFASHLVVLMALLHIPGHNWPRAAKTLPQLVVLCTATLLIATAMTLVIKRIPLLRRSV